MVRDYAAVTQDDLDPLKFVGPLRIGGMSSAEMKQFLLQQNRMRHDLEHMAVFGHGVVFTQQQLREVAFRIAWLEERVRRGTSEAMLRMESELVRLRAEVPVEFEPEDEREASELICMRRQLGLPTEDLEKRWNL